VHVTFGSCAPVDCATKGPPPAVPVAILSGGVTATTATVQIEQVGDGQVADGRTPVASYELRVAPLARHGAIDISPTDFVSWTPEAAPSPATPGTLTDVALTGLSPDTAYGVGVAAHGSCGSSPVSFARFTTPAAPVDTHLTGCFIATAAFGSDLAPEVDALRRVRDAAVGASGLARVAAELYYAAAPAAARVLRETDVGRVAVRAPLRPIARLGAVVARSLSCSRSGCR
jgi:hypothetical protein